MSKLPLISVGDQVFGTEGGEEFGAVRDVSPGGRAEIVIFVENAGDFTIPLDAITAVHDRKVVVALPKLGSVLHEAVRRAHARERL
jgi:hypothetical protein